MLSDGKMKAIVFTEYGPPDVLKLKEVDKPVPKENELRIRVHATSVAYGDLKVRDKSAVTLSKLSMPGPFVLVNIAIFGYSKPKINILGADFAGEIEAVGADVKSFQVGDQVFGYHGPFMGAYAQYLCMPADGVLAAKPTNMTYEQAAVLPYGSIMALSLLKSGNIQPGHKVLINGASGGIGSAAVQLARYHLGAQVTGVCGTPRLEFVKALGAEKVIDYTQEDFTQSGETYDLIFDILGVSSLASCKNSLKPDGRYLLVSFKMKQLFEMLWTSILGILPGRGSNKKVICAVAPGSRDDLLTIKELIEAGKLKAIIDKSFPLEEAAEAHRYVESGHKKGHVVISVEHSNQTD